eukprot:99502-Rhodomonas_salina.1
MLQARASWQRRSSCSVARSRSIARNLPSRSAMPDADRLHGGGQVKITGHSGRPGVVPVVLAKMTANAPQVRGSNPGADRVFVCVRMERSEVDCSPDASRWSRRRVLVDCE